MHDQVEEMTGNRMLMVVDAGVVGLRVSGGSRRSNGGGVCGCGRCCGIGWGGLLLS